MKVDNLGFILESDNYLSKNEIVYLYTPVVNKNVTSKTKINGWIECYKALNYKNSIKDR